jgi:hypothetical protein
MLCAELECAGTCQERRRFGLLRLPASLPPRVRTLRSAAIAARAAMQPQPQPLDHADTVGKVGRFLVPACNCTPAEER